MPAPSPCETAGAASAAPPARAPWAAAAAPHATTVRTPLGFVVDEESSIRHFVSLILQGTGVDTMEFADGNTFRKARATSAPDLVFLNVDLDAQDAIQSIEALGQSGYTGAVQLISNRGSAVLETSSSSASSRSSRCCRCSRSRSRPPRSRRSWAS